MSRDESEGLNALFQDVMESDLPDPELLARYATAPNELTAEERDQVETAMRRSPVVVDELDTLRGFDFGALDADREGVGGRGRLGAWFVSLLGQPVTWAGVAAAAALGLWVALSGGDRLPAAPERESVRMVEGAADAEPKGEADSREPDSLPRPIDEGVERLVEAGSSDAPIDSRPESAEASPDPPETRLADAATDPASAERRPPGMHRGEQGEAQPAQTAEGSDEPSVQPEILLAMVMPAYEVPVGAAQRHRAVPAYRSPSEERPQITALAPPHVAWSASARPTLYWRIDRVPSRGAFYLTLSDAADEPVVENRRLPMPTESGIQGTPIAGLDAELRPGVEYRWSIAHRLDEDSPPTAYSFGWVQAVEMAVPMRESLEESEPGARPDLLARGGYWYDALQATLDLVARYPLDEGPRDGLNALLEQGGVSDLPR